MGDLVAKGGRCRVEELEMIMDAEINEALGLPSVVGTSPWSESM